MPKDNVYIDGILRLTKRAVDLGISLPGDIWSRGRMPHHTHEDYATAICKTKIGDAIMDRIEDTHLRYVSRIADAGRNNPSWHCIEYTRTSNLSRYTDIEAGRSFESVIERIREVTEAEGQELQVDETASGRHNIFVDGEYSAIVKPIQFKSVEVALVRKSLSVLKDVTSGKGKNNLRRILAPILNGKPADPPACDQCTDVDDYPIYITLNTLSRAVQRGMECLGAKVSKGHSQELLAAFFNYPSWNHLRAIERSCDDIAINPAVVSVTKASISEQSYFKDASHALAFFSTCIDQNINCDVEVSGVNGSIEIWQSPYGPRYAQDFTASIPSESVLMTTLYQVDQYEIMP